MRKADVTHPALGLIDHVSYWKFDVIRTARYVPLYDCEIVALRGPVGALDVI